MAIYKSLLTRLIQTFLLVLILSSCSNSDTELDASSPKADIRNQEFNWDNNNSLINEIEKVLKSHCEEFQLNSENIRIQHDLPEDSLKIFVINNEAQLFLYIDGALEPNIEDEKSATIYYETWKCKPDTLYIEQLRVLEGNDRQTQSQVKLSDCGYGYSVRPKTITITCADGGIRIENIVWNSWNSFEASGTGVFKENMCDPDCASGNYTELSATINLGSVITDRNGSKVFSEIGVQTKRQQASGAYLDTFELSYER